MSGKMVKIIDGGHPIAWFHDLVGKKAKVLEEIRDNGFYWVRFPDGRTGGLPILVTKEVPVQKRRKHILSAPGEYHDEGAPYRPVIGEYRNSKARRRKRMLLGRRR